MARSGTLWALRRPVTDACRSQDRWSQLYQDLRHGKVAALDPTTSRRAAWQAHVFREAIDAIRPTAAQMSSRLPSVSSGRSTAIRVAFRCVVATTHVLTVADPAAGLHRWERMHREAIARYNDFHFDWMPDIHDIPADRPKMLGLLGGRDLTKVATTSVIYASSRGSGLVRVPGSACSRRG